MKTVIQSFSDIITNSSSEVFVSSSSDELLQALKELNIDYSKIDKIGIMAGASTPKDSIENIRIYLENM